MSLIGTELVTGGPDKWPDARRRRWRPVSLIGTELVTGGPDKWPDATPPPVSVRRRGQPRLG